MKVSEEDDARKYSDNGNYGIHDWHYGICSSCLRNSHEAVKMVKQRIKRTGRADCTDEIEVWICPNCGYCREL